MYPLSEEPLSSAIGTEDFSDETWTAILKLKNFVAKHFKEIIPLGSDFLVETSGKVESELWEEFLGLIGREMGSHPWVITQGPNLYLVTLVP
ncbi:MAG: hypothetical protein ACFFB3_10595 [Candidatus Hodarchaeota archaeon]